MYYERNIDTNTDGLIFQVEHNLDGHPVPFLWEPTTLGDMQYVAPYDSRIAGIETKGPNVIQLSFASAFSGKIQLKIFKQDDFSQEEKIQDIDRRLKDLTVNHRKLVTKDQWSKMNSYLEGKSDTAKVDLDELTEEVKGIKEDVENL